MKPKICIVAPWAYPLFHPENNGHFGGWEVRMALIARELACRGNFIVNMVVGDHGQPHVEKLENIHFYSWRWREIWGIPLQEKVDLTLENIWWRIRFPFRSQLEGGQVGNYCITPDMISVYDEIDADIYTVPGNSQFSGELAFYCKQRRKKYVFLAGSDMDCYPELKTEPTKMDIYSVPHSLKTYAIENATIHLVQNEWQSRTLKQVFDRESQIIRNPIDLAKKYPRSKNPKSVLWVGKSDERVKRPSQLFELARRLPDVPFMMILNKGLPETHELCLQEVRNIPNIELIERVPFEEIERHYAAARLLVNTSVFEGFPNTFLQAAKYGVPIVATDVDPGAMLSYHHCGICCKGDFEKFVKSVERFMDDNEFYKQYSDTIEKYVRSYHDKDLVISQYEKAFNELLEK
ncbi:MAG: glycosyltransferase family 4 protein [Bacteroidales bacterium]|nr:glycosyltransferase family 4 protein [Bacteroidales bacterium]